MKQNQWIIHKNIMAHKTNIYNEIELSDNSLQLTID